MPDRASRPHRGPIGWGDALWAAGELGLTAPADLAALVDLLGITAPPPADQGVPSVPAQFDPGGARPAVRLSPWAAPPADDEVRPPPDQRTVLEPLPDEPVGPVDFGDEPPLEPAGAELAAVPYQPPGSVPALRAALATLVSRLRLSDDIDLDAAADLLAEQRPLDRLPRRVEPSVGHGATVVADLGPGMLPYLEDVAWFVAEIRQLVGTSRLTLIPVDNGEPRQKPELEPGRPVLIVSTLGVAEPMGARHGGQGWWLALAEQARIAETEVVALVPHRDHLWSAALRRSLCIIPWDDLAMVGHGQH